MSNSNSDEFNHFDLCVMQCNKMHPCDICAPSCPGAFGRKTLFPQVATEVGVVNTVSDLEPRLDYDIVRGGNDNDILSLPGSY